MNTTTTYTIKPGSIAAVQYIECGDGRRMTAIYMSEERQPEVHLDGRGLANIRDTLPVPVLAAINRNFGLMFSLPVERRQALIDNTQPVTVTVEGESTCQDQ